MNEAIKYFFYYRIVNQERVKWLIVVILGGIFVIFTSEEIIKLFDNELSPPSNLEISFLAFIFFELALWVIGGYSIVNSSLKFNNIKYIVFGLWSFAIDVIIASFVLYLLMLTAGIDQYNPYLQNKNSMYLLAVFIGTILALSENIIVKLDASDILLERSEEILKSSKQSQNMLNDTKISYRNKKINKFDNLIKRSEKLIDKK